MPNNNPTGKGGLQERPEDINRGGRTKKYLTELLETIGAEIEPKSLKTYKELISRRAWIDALNGDQRAIEFIFDRIEGKPQQNTDITSKGERVLALPSELLKKNEITSTTK